MVWSDAVRFVRQSRHDSAVLGQALSGSAALGPVRRCRAVSASLAIVRLGSVRRGSSGGACSRPARLGEASSREAVIAWSVAAGPVIAGDGMVRLGDAALVGSRLVLLVPALQHTARQSSHVAVRHRPACSGSPGPLRLRSSHSRQGRFSVVLGSQRVAGPASRWARNGPARLGNAGMESLGSAGSGIAALGMAV